MHVYLGVVSTEYHHLANRGFGFGSVPVTALLVYLLQLLPVIFTYLRADCPLTSFRLLSGSGRVESRIKNPDAVPSLVAVVAAVLQVSL